MFCSNCGSKVPEEAVFCPECGTCVSKPEQVTSFTQADISSHIESGQEQPLAESVHTDQFPAPMSPKKKKSKRGLAVGLGCGGAALIGAGVLTYSLATGAVMRTFMGDIEYAKSVNSGYVASEFADYTGIAETAVQASSGYVGNIVGAFTSISAGSGLRYDDDGESIYDKYDVSTVLTAQSYYRYYDLLEAFGKEGAAITVTADAQLSADIAELLDKPELKPYIGDFADAANTSGLSLSFAEVSGALNISMNADKNGAYFVGTLMQLSEDGDLTVYLPEASKRAIKMKLPSKNEIEENVGGYRYTARGKFDPEKLRKLYTELKKAYYDCYEYAVINYDDGAVSFGETVEKCTVITVKFDADGIVKILEKFADVFENDDTLDEMFPIFSNDGKTASKMLAETLRDGMKNYRESPEKYSDVFFVSESYVTAQNKPLGVKYTLTQGGTELFSLTSLDNGKTAIIRLSAGGKTYAEIDAAKSDNKSGSAELSIYPDGTYDKDITICIDYSDIHTFHAFDKKMFAGSCTLYLKDTPTLRDTFLRTENKQTEALLGTKLTFSCKPDGSGCRSSVGLSHDRYGSLAVNVDMKPGGVIPAAPAGCTYIDPVKEPAEASEMGYDLYSYLYGKIESDAALKKLDGDFSALGKGLLDSLSDEMKKIENERSLKEKYSRYDGKSGYYASTSAYSIYTCADAGAISSGEPIKIRLYYDRNGNLTIVDACGEDTDALKKMFSDGIRNSTFRNIDDTYTEVWFWKAYNNSSPVGVTVVRADNPDVDAKLPGLNDYLGGVFPWEDENFNTHIQDGYVVATYPELEKGDAANVSDIAATLERAMVSSEPLTIAAPQYNDFTSMLEDHSDIEAIGALKGQYEINGIDARDSAYNNFLYGAFYEDRYDVPDIFVLEPEQISDFIDFAMTAEELGITADISDMTAYTKRVGSNSGGDTAAFTPGICNCAFVFRKDIAREVLGTDDPYDVYSAIEGWDKFTETADKMKQKGYCMVPNTDIMLRAFVQNIEELDELTFPDNKDFGFGVTDWIKLSKKFYDKGYTPGYESWSGEWLNEHTANGKCFGDILPLWALGEYIMSGDEWSVTFPPQDCYWGGYYICVSKTCRNKELAAKIVKTLTCDEVTLYELALTTHDMIPNIGVEDLIKFSNDKRCTTGLGKFSVVSGEDIVRAYISSVNSFALPLQPKDAYLVIDYLPYYMRNYFKGSETYENAADNFFRQNYPIN